MIAVCVVGVAFVGPAAAQPIPSGFPGNTGEAIKVGPFLFSPAVELKWEDRDNIFFTPTNPVHDHIYTARGRLLFELPIYESYVRFAYTPQYREYEKYNLRHKWAHFFDFNTVLEFESGLRFRADYRFVNAAQETSEVDAGGELVFADQLFTKNYGKVALDYWFSARDGITIEGDYTDLTYDYPTGTPQRNRIFYDYERNSVGLGWLHQLSAILVMDLKYDRIQFDPVDTLTWRSYTADEVTLGFKGQLSPVVAAQFRLGWNETEYDRTAGVLPAPEFSDFSGLVMSGFINWELAHGSHVRLDLIRSPFPSNFDLNAYYVATGGTLTYSIDRRKFFGELFGRLQNNDYELPDVSSGLPRSDDIRTFGLGLGWRFTDWLALRGAYLYEERDTLEPYSYEVNIWTLGLVIGY